MSDKFKFTAEETVSIESKMIEFADNPNMRYVDLMQYIESIISERDGWIDVAQQKPKSDTSVIVWDGQSVYSAHFDDYYEDEPEWTDINGDGCNPLPIKWQPLPSAPKQPKK